MAGEIVSALQDAVAKNPDKAYEVAQQLKSQFASLSPAEKQQAVAALQDLQARAANLTDAQKAEIASSIRGMAA